MLVAAGASLTIRDSQGNTPRQLAMRADDQELAVYLESKCRLLSVSSPSSNTPSSSTVTTTVIASNDAVRNKSEVCPAETEPVSTQEPTSLSAQSAACAQALTQALAEVLAEESIGIGMNVGLDMPCQSYDYPTQQIKETRPQTAAANKRLRMERLI